MPNIIKVNYNIINYVKASRGAGAQSVTVKSEFVLSIPTRGDEIVKQMYISISSLWCRGKARR